MRMMDYESNRSLNDVGIFLTIDEAEELLESLKRLKEVPSVQRIYISEIAEVRLERELAVSLTDEIDEEMRQRVNVV